MNKSTSKDLARIASGPLMLEDLPPEIIIKILSLLSIKDLSKFALTNKHMNMVYHDDLLWRNLYYIKWQKYEEICEVNWSWKKKYHLRLSENWKRGIPLFNNNPAEGIQFLIDERYISNTTEDIVNFILYNTQLNSTAVGGYLSSVGPLKEFVRALKIDDLTIDEALRRVMERMRIPGESRRLKSVLRTLSDEFYDINKHRGIWANADSVYIVTFCTLLLNVDLHNPRVTTKMTKKQFTSNCLACDTTIPELYLSDIYDRVEEVEFGQIKNPSSDKKTKKFIKFPSIKLW